MYPKDKGEVEKFVSGIIMSLHSEQTRDKIMAQLTNQQAPVPVRIASVVSQVISTMIIRVQQQAKRKPHVKLLLNAIKMTVKEVAKMAQIAGVKVTPEDMRNAAKIAGDMIDNGQQQPQQMQQAQQQTQQQGLVGGAM